MRSAEGSNHFDYQERAIGDLDKLVWSARRSIIHVETLDHYGVPDDDLMFSLWQKGEAPTIEQLSGYRHWFSQVEAATRRGVQVDRVHIVPETLTPYLRFEIEFAYHQFCEPSGERVWILQREHNQNLASRVKADFYLIDEQKLLLPQYNRENNFVALREATQVSDIELHRALRLELLKESRPLKEFYAAMKRAPVRVGAKR